MIKIQVLDKKKIKILEKSEKNLKTKNRPGKKRNFWLNPGAKWHNLV